LSFSEGIWKRLKYVELANVCCRRLSELRVELRKAKERLRHKKLPILGCIRLPDDRHRSATPTITSWRESSKKIQRGEWGAG
jgi:hypothetical protein